MESKNKKPETKDDRDRPFIHLIELPLGYYIYDVNCNSIIRVEKDVYLHLRSILDGSEAGVVEPDDEVSGRIRELKRAGFLSHNRVKTIVHPDDENLESLLESGLSALTLQVTQQCNLRCRYCIYSGSYEQRSHAAKSMTWETAKKAIDFLASRSFDSRIITLGFYGGEPLLEFDMIKRCVDHITDVCRGKELQFNMTTNGTLLDEETVAYLASRHFRILISLDGPAEVHDRNRRFARTGGGSFGRIMENLSAIEKKYPDFTEKYVSFSTVIDPESDFSCLNEFFLNYESVKKANIMPTYVSDLYAIKRKNATEDFIVQSQYEQFKAMLLRLGRLDDQDVSRLSVKLVDSTLIRRLRLLDNRTKLAPKYHPSGPCIPGVKKLFVNADGYFFPCERVSEKSEAVRIGHVDRGFDVQRIRAMLNIGKLTEESCRNCWAITHCDQCATSADGFGELSATLKAGQCGKTRYRADNALRDYITVQELKGKLIRPVVAVEGA